LSRFFSERILRVKKNAHSGCTRRHNSSAHHRLACFCSAHRRLACFCIAMFAHRYPHSVHAHSDGCGRLCLSYHQHTGRLRSQVGGKYCCCPGAMYRDGVEKDESCFDTPCSASVYSRTAPLRSSSRGLASAVPKERERTFIMVKPDAVQRGLVGQIIT
jgi:hypothetical protein